MSIGPGALIIALAVGVANAIAAALVGRARR
jgi:hypothetical protein